LCNVYRQKKIIIEYKTILLSVRLSLNCRSNRKSKSINLHMHVLIIICSDIKWKLYSDGQITMTFWYWSWSCDLQKPIWGKSDYCWCWSLAWLSHYQGSHLISGCHIMIFVTFFISILWHILWLSLRKSIHMILL
jgi:hypothetical protein